jgi:hypothetical protein
MNIEDCSNLKQVTEIEYKLKLIEQLEQLLLPLDITGVSEQDYCSIVSRAETIEEIIELIKNQ